MAKKDQVQDEVQEQEQAESLKVDPMPVERQEAVHNEQACNPKAALQPGRPFVYGDDLMGELEKLIHDAEVDGNADLAGELHGVRLKIGDLLNHLSNHEQSTAANFYVKIKAFFKR